LTKPALPKIERFAAEPGVNPEFDAIWDKSLASINASGGFEADTMEPMRQLGDELGVSAEEAARHRLFHVLTADGKKTWQHGFHPSEPSINDWTPATETDEPADPVTLVVPPLPTDPYWYDDPADARVLDHYILSRRALGNAMHGALLITGPAGSGKSQCVPHAVRRINAEHRLDLRFLKMDCATVTDPQKWFGRREVDKSGTKFIRSDFVTAVESGYVILLDDMARLHPTIHNGVFGLLDGFEAVNLSDLNLTITRHPETVFIATVNQGVQYGGQHRMDAAFRERFSRTIERTWPPRDEEVRIITSQTGCDPDGAGRLVDFAAKTRQMYGAGDLRTETSTRVLRDAGWLVRSGMSEAEALEYTALPLYDGNADGLTGTETDRQKVAFVIHGLLGKGSGNRQGKSRG
jgi:hypothetical protein